MNNRLITRRASAALMAMLVAAVTVSPAQARVGQSRDSTRSYSAPSRAPQAPAKAPSVRRDSSRLGAGGSVGMRRPDVTQRARTDRATQPGAVAPRGPVAGAAGSAATGSAAGGLASRGVPATPPVSGYGAQQPVQQGRGGSWVGPAVAGAAIGAAAGYALGNRNDQSAAAPGAASEARTPSDASSAAGMNATESGAAGGSPSSSGASGTTGSLGDGGPSGATGSFPGAASAAPARTQGMGTMGFGLVVLLLAGLAFMMFRKRSAANAARAGNSRFGYGHGAPVGGPATTTGGMMPGAATVGFDGDVRSLTANAKAFYTQLQELNNRGDLAGLRARTTDDIFPALAADVQGRTHPSTTTVMSVDAQLIDSTHEANRSIASVRYRSMVSEGPNEPPQSVDEVWHFVKDAAPSAPWKLAGIEEV